MNDHVIRRNILKEVQTNKTVLDGIHLLKQRLDVLFTIQNLPICVKRLTNEKEFKRMSFIGSGYIHYSISQLLFFRYPAFKRDKLIELTNMIINDFNLEILFDLLDLRKRQVLKFRNKRLIIKTMVAELTISIQSNADPLKKEFLDVFYTVILFLGEKHFQILEDYRKKSANDFLLSRSKPNRTFNSVMPVSQQMNPQMNQFVMNQPRHIQQVPQQQHIQQFQQHQNMQQFQQHQNIQQYPVQNIQQIPLQNMQQVQPQQFQQFQNFPPHQQNQQTQQYNNSKSNYSTTTVDGKHTTILKGDERFPKKIYRIYPYNSKLFIGNVDTPNINIEDIFDVFSKYGELQEKIEFRGKFAFVQYENAEIATVALNSENGNMLGRKRLRIDYAVEKKFGQLHPKFGLIKQRFNN